MSGARLDRILFQNYSDILRQLAAEGKSGVK
jgi:hypothetical protein